MGLGPYRRLRERRVIINMTEDGGRGRAWEAVIVAVNGPLVSLKGAVMMEPGSEPVRMDGEVVIDRAFIDFIQAY